jgi:DNA mismatch repair ATPase MutS
MLTAGTRVTGELDCLCALAHVALYKDWVRPTFASRDARTGSLSWAVQPATDLSTEAFDAAGAPDGSSGLRLLGLRHPLLEDTLGEGKFVPSSLEMAGAQKMCIITGPNMGGKSTFMRAVGICTVLAQMGSFVPAKSAHMSVMDKLFVRIGAGDDMSLGISTFMAEMLSVGNILKNATLQSMVLVDELGEDFCRSSTLFAILVVQTAPGGSRRCDFFSDLGRVRDLVLRNPERILH